MEFSKKFLVKMIIIIILALLCVFQTIYHIVVLLSGGIHDKHLIVSSSDVGVVTEYLNANSTKYVADCGDNAGSIKPVLVKKTTEKQGKKEKTALTVSCQKGYEYKFSTEGSTLEAYVNEHGSNTIIHIIIVMVINIGFIAFFIYLMKKSYDSEFGSTNELKPKEAKQK